MCLSKPGSLPVQDPCQPKIPVNPRSQSTQDPCQLKIPVIPGCLHAYLAHGYLAHGYLAHGYLFHAYLIFGSCLFDIWLINGCSWLIRNPHQLNFPIPTWISVICIWHMHIFPSQKKMHEPRSCCTLFSA